MFPFLTASIFFTNMSKASWQTSAHTQNNPTQTCSVPFIQASTFTLEVRNKNKRKFSRVGEFYCLSKIQGKKSTLATPVGVLELMGLCHIPNHPGIELQLMSYSPTSQIDTAEMVPSLKSVSCVLRQRVEVTAFFPFFLIFLFPLKHITHATSLKVLKLFGTHHRYSCQLIYRIDCG